jgi:hypothetical protein
LHEGRSKLEGERTPRSWHALCIPLDKLRIHFCKAPDIGVALRQEPL